MLAATMLTPGLASASSDDAWEALRLRLIETCDEAARTAAPEARIAVHANEFGTEMTALALVVTTREGQEEPELAVCLHDKRTGATELSAPFAQMPDLAGAGDAGP